MPTVAVDLVFTALADATRRHILEMLAEEGAASASAIAHHLPISRQAIAKHLGLLEQAGLVSRLRDGKEICFQAGMKRFLTKPLTVNTLTEVIEDL